ncbi:MAG: APC family permease [Nitrososphaerales archaeon]
MQRKRAQSLRRNIGVLGNFAFGYADVAEGIYFTLGLVAISAGPAASYAYLFATIAYVFTALSYAELASTYHEAGGAFIYAKKAFGKNIAFLTAWALLLDYIVTTSISALAAIGYLGYFFPFLNIPFIFGISAALVIIFLMILNIVGLAESARFSYLMVLFNIVGLVAILGVGYIFSYHPGINQIHFGSAPTYPGFLYGVTIAMSSYLGIEVISQSAGETKRPSKSIPRAVFLISSAVVSIALAFSTLALGVVPYQAFQQNPSSINDPISFIASHLPFGFYLGGLAAILGIAILLVATNSGIIGVSRITYAMSDQGVIPRLFSRLHKKFRTPYIALIVFSSVSILVALSGQIDLVAQLYNFGALLAYMIVGLSLISLRNKEKGLLRPFKTPGSFTLKRGDKKYSVPIIGVLTFTADLIIWLLVVSLHPLGREVGALWMAIGFAIFFIYGRIHKDQASPALGLLGESSEQARQNV